MRRTLCLLAVTASLAVTSFQGAAWAQPAPNPEAVRHFQEGKRLRDEGRCDLAIKELEASVKIEPSIGGHYNLGVCYEGKNKRLALVNYQKAEDIAKARGDDRLREIRAQRADFLARTPHLRLALPQPLPPDIKVTVDGDSIPVEELQGETTYFLPDGNKAAYDVRVTAPGYEDVKLSIDSSTVAKNMLVTVPMKKTSDGSVAQPMVRREVETKWGPFQFLGLGLIAAGAVGVTYGTVAGISYKAEESNLRDKFTEAENAAKNCASTSPPESTCGRNIATREDLRKQYNDNETYANKNKGLWLAFGIGGALAIVGGALLIAIGPRTEVPLDPGATAKAKPIRPTMRLVPTFTPQDQGLSVVGTF